MRANCLSLLGRFLWFWPVLSGLLALRLASAQEPLIHDRQQVILPGDGLTEAAAASTGGPQPAFSFRYDGRSSAELLPRWRKQRPSPRRAPGWTQWSTAYLDPGSGLEVTCRAKEYAGFAATEWLLTFENKGTRDTPILDQVLPLDLQLARRGSGEFKLRYAEGSHERITDFQPFEVPLPPGTNRQFTAYGGRPSDGFLPFFHVVQPAGGGAIVALGWTGQWSARFARDETTHLTMQAGMEQMRLRLHPGERIRTPAILVMSYTGKAVQGQNRFRRLLLEHFAPKPKGKPATPLFAASPHAAVPFERTTETNMIQAIRNLAAHRVPVDYWWIDAGWFDCGGNWARGVGNWDPAPARFPRGLQPVAAAAHQAGMKFLLWFEPERVMPGTWLYQHHGDWLLKPRGDMPAELQYHVKDGFHLLNLGDPAALRWAQRRFSGIIERVGIDAYRNDFNLYPLWYWRNAEPPDRQGLNEIRYVSGLYDLFDALRRRHPRLLLDNCASGGRRIDFEMLRRALVLTRSDYLWDPVGQQCHTYGLAQWLPITGIGAASLDLYNCRSGWGSHFVLAADFYSHDPRFWESVLQRVREWRQLAPLYTGDFYPLSDYSVATNVWMAWQFHRADLGQGVVQAFRRPDAPEERATYRLQGLDRATVYSVRNLDEPTPGKRTGRELMEEGLAVFAPTRPASLVFTYGVGPHY